MKGAAANRRAPCVGLGKIKNTFGFTLCERTCSPTQGFVFMRRKAAMKREAKKRHHLIGVLPRLLMSLERTTSYSKRPKSRNG